MWAVMMARGEERNFTLPASKSRDEGVKKGINEKDKKIVAREPMAANKVKPDWRGETRETLLAKDDMLPSAVRDCLRAFWSLLTITLLRRLQRNQHTLLKPKMRNPSPANNSIR
jgi:hypothetical protein